MGQEGLIKELTGGTMSKVVKEPAESGHYWAKWWYGVTPNWEMVMYDADDDIVYAIGSSKEHKVIDFVEYTKVEIPKEFR